MEYSIKKLSEIAGVSARTLRYYDEIGILKPLRINSSGYRIYGPKEVDVLQQILFYKELGLKLQDIKDIITDPNYDLEEALEKQYEALIEKRNQMNLVIANLEKTMAYRKGEVNMTDREKFEGFKKQKVSENEKKYGKEIRSKYGNDAIDLSNSKFMNLSEESYIEMTNTEAKMLDCLKRVMESGSIEGAEAKTVFECHKKWLSYVWKTYSKEAHIGLANMYVADDRFTKYYDDKLGNGAAEVLKDIICKYAY